MGGPIRGKVLRVLVVHLAGTRQTVGVTTTSAELISVHVAQPALLFDLDGTLIDSVYQHVISWQEALSACGIPLAVWRIHRRIGMSGGLFLDALQRETGITLDDQKLEKLGEMHAEAFLKRADSVIPLPGAKELLAHLYERKVPFAIATSGIKRTAAHGMKMLGLPDDVPAVTRDRVERAEPDPQASMFSAATWPLSWA